MDFSGQLLLHLSIPWLYDGLFQPYGKLKFFTKKTAIWSRVTGEPGQ
jgi:hypothetical protein